MRKLFLWLLFFGVSFGVFAQEPIRHTVVKDDTITGLVRKYGVTVHDIFTLNPNSRNGINLGEVILIPQNDRNAKLQPKDGLYHKVEPKETLFGLAQKYRTTIQAIQEANQELLINGLQPDIELRIPTGKKVESKSTIIKNDDVIHIVQPKETLFGISKKYEISKEELIKNNPEYTHLKDDIIKIGDTIKVSLTKIEEALAEKIEAEKESEKENQLATTASAKFKDLSKKLRGSDRKKVVIMLPFNADRVGQDSNDIQETLKTNQFLNITVDFYSGALVAIDSIKKLGGNFDVVFLDSEESNSGSAVERLIATQNFSDVDVIIGPLMSTHSEKAASLLSSKKITVVSPLSREGKKTPYDNLYLATPPTEVSKRMMLNYLKQKNQNVIAVVDKRRQSYRNFIANNYPGISFASLTDKGILNVDNLKSLLRTDQTNYVILETESSSMVLNTTRTLLNLLSIYDIKLVVLEKNAAFESDEIQSTTLARLNMHYPSSIRDLSSDETSSFYTEYKKKNNVFPSHYAVRGFDVVYDVLLRLAQDQSFEKLAKNIATEQVDSKFVYTQSPEGGYYNTGVYILYYDQDLTIKEAQ